MGTNINTLSTTIGREILLLEVRLAELDLQLEDCFTSEGLNEFIQVENDLNALKVRV